MDERKVESIYNQIVEGFVSYLQPSFLELTGGNSRRNDAILRRTYCTLGAVGQR